MIEPGLALLVPEVPAWGTAILLLAGLAGAFVTTAFGAGGGVLLLAVLPVFLPVAAVIPVHGVLQAGSNGLRTGLLFRHIRWPLLLAFTGGGLVGTAIGASVFVRLPESWLELVLGGFILWICWGPRPRIRRRSLAVIGAGGAVTGALTLFVGATGPFVAALLGALGLERHAHMGTFSACMLLQHALKIGAFGVLGFAFTPWMPFIVAMFLAAAVGTWLGRCVLGRMGDARFHRVLAVILTLLALRLVVSGMLGVTAAADAATVVGA
ncbi:MAG: sulfite exporter TauE/SafE family protein [Halofilum sp. (in: g-proteobacteria)]